MARNNKIIIIHVGIRGHFLAHTQANQTSAFSLILFTSHCLHTRKLNEATKDLECAQTAGTTKQRDAEKALHPIRTLFMVLADNVLPLSLEKHIRLNYDAT